MQIHAKEILITDDSILIDIQDTFTTYFPFLKIDFLNGSFPTNTARNITIDPRLSLKKIITTALPQLINIDDRRTVSEITNDFMSQLGILIQVSRRSGKVWNVISVTNGWTLNNQNEAGEFITSEMAEE